MTSEPYQQSCSLRTYPHTLVIDHVADLTKTIVNHAQVLLTVRHGNYPEISINTLRPRQNSSYFTSDIFKYISMKEHFCS